MIDIVIGTRLLSDLAATHAAVFNLGIKAHVVAFEAISLMAKQPFGFGAIYYACTNRAYDASVLYYKNSCKNNSIFIGIASGLVLKDQKYCLVIGAQAMDTGGKIDGYWSRLIPVPELEVGIALTIGFAKTSFSEVFAQRNNISPDDPFPLLTGGEYSRQSLVYETVVQLLIKIENRGWFK